MRLRILGGAKHKQSGTGGPDGLQQVGLPLNNVPDTSSGRALCFGFLPEKSSSSVGPCQPCGFIPSEECSYLLSDQGVFPSFIFPSGKCQDNLLGYHFLVSWERVLPSRWSLSGRYSQTILEWDLGLLLDRFVWSRGSSVDKSLPLIKFQTPPG